MINKIVLISAVVLLTSLVSSQPIDEAYNYDAFMLQFDRNYTGDERMHHEQIFNQNYAELLRMRAEGHDLQVNEFLDWNSTQRRALNNFTPNEEEQPLTSSSALRSNLLFASPPSHDYRTLGRVTPVKNQGQCGSCWTFASTAQYESLLARQRNGTMFDLAEHYSLQCQTTSFGCNGGYVSKALKIYNTTGIPPEVNYPYQGVDRFYTNSNRSICTDTNRTKLNANITRVQYTTTLTMEQLQQELVNVGPLTVGVNASHNAFWYAGPSGLINCPNVTSMDHAILLVGYNETHWFIKNSWGTNWGHGGYGYINKSSDCNLKSYAYIMEANFTAPVPPPSPTPTPNNTNNTVVTDNTVNVSIVMRDSGGNGYNGNVFGIFQNGSLVARFGSGFTTGSSSGPFNLTIYTGTMATIQFVQKGNRTHEIGFTLRFRNNTIIYNLNAGSPLSSSRIFKRFCPGGTCPQPSNIVYQLFLSDSWGDGWNGVTLCLRQNNTIGQNFSILSSTGREEGPIAIPLRREVKTDIVVCKMGLYTQQIGFFVRNEDGIVVASRYPGATFAANTILASFCPDCINMRSIATTAGYYEYEQELISTEQKAAQAAQIKQNNGFLIATCILAPLCTILTIALVCSIIKVKNLSSSLIIPQQASSKIILDNKSQVNTKFEKRSVVSGEDTTIDKIKC